MVSVGVNPMAHQYIKSVACSADNPTNVTVSYRKAPG
jgi:hypothetical protein